MAVVPLTASTVTYPQIDTRPILGVNEEDELFGVALGKDVKEADKVLMWVLHNNSRGRRICVLHVHQPAQKMPLMGTKVSISLMEDSQVKKYHENERHGMHKILDKYVKTCERAGARAMKLCIEMDSVEQGLVQLIAENGIKWLVMGAAASKSYSRRMKEPKSKKAIYVHREAPLFCHIWFVCKGNLIHTRQSKPSGIEIMLDSRPVQASPNAETVQTFGSLTLAEGVNLRDSVVGYHRVRSDNHEIQLLAESIGSPQSCFTPEANSEWDVLSRRSPSVASRLSTCSSSEITEEKTPHQRTEGRITEFESPMLHQRNPYHSYSLAPSGVECNMNDELYERLDQFVAEAETSQRELFEESIKRKKAEKDVIDAIRRVKASELMYNEEIRRTRGVLEALVRSREEVEKAQGQLDELKEKLRVAEEQKSTMEGQIVDSDKMVEQLEQRMFSAVELLHKYKKERDELEVERDNALMAAEELREKQAAEAPGSFVPQFFSEFSFWEIKEGTNDFSRSLKIGEGSYGSIYRGYLRYTQVAIKTLHANSSEGPIDFQQKVNILSKLRHPNLITLIGACPEACALIYEYLPNGSLEDRLNCKENTPPLSWQTRIRIAAELCSALMFLHSCHPEGIGDLKPSNILLDANFVSKLRDFGIDRLFCQDPTNSRIRCRVTNPKGTLAYLDPYFLRTGELTSKSDVFSFGIVLLRLLTGRPASGIFLQEVENVLHKGDLKELLDPTAGDWPFVQAKQLANLAISCSAMEPRHRPDLASEVWRVLEPMKVSCGVSSIRCGSEMSDHVPSYFICPIFQEIMQDPVVAADGFTYEAEAVKGWLDSGHDTSPMTNLTLPHCNLIPNRALRSAIQEWLQKP